MNEQQLNLTRLLGKKELTEGCRINISEYEYTVTKDMVFKKSSEKITEVYEEWHGEHLGQLCGIIGHPASLSDLHRWMNEKIKKVSDGHFSQGPDEIRFCLAWRDEIKMFEFDITIPYGSSKDLLDQSTQTLDKIIELIKSNS